MQQGDDSDDGNNQPADQSAEPSGKEFPHEQETSIESNEDGDLTRQETVIESKVDDVPPQQATSIQAGLNAITASLKQLVERITHLEEWIKYWRIPAVLAAFAFFGSLYQNVDGICKLGLLESTCRAHGWGHLATVDEVVQKERAFSQDNCDAIARYKSPNVANGEFIAEAEARLALKQPKIEKVAVPFERAIPKWEMGREPTEEAARSALALHSKEIATTYCLKRSKPLGPGSLANPGRYEMHGQVICDHDWRGHACGMEGEIICDLHVPALEPTCPAEHIQ